MEIPNPFKSVFNTESESDNATDKIFLRNVGISIFAILICIVMLTATTFAWFNTTIESTEQITSATYVLKITTTDGSEVSIPRIDEDGHLIYTLIGGKTYTVTAVCDAEQTTAKTGYIKLRIGDKTYYSAQIDDGETDNSLTFTLKFDVATELMIIKCWGTSSVPENNRDITDGGVYDNLGNAENN